MYTLANMQDSIKKVEATRAQRMATEPRRMTADEKDALLAAYHPDYKEEGFIWFLEACDLNVMAIRRAMWQMEHAGWFRYVKGFLIGRPLVHGQEMMGLDQYHAVLDIIAHHNVPVIMDADLGHIAPMLPLISGSYANITATGNNLVVDMKLK